MSGTCTRSHDGTHAFWAVMRLPWPFGLFLPMERRCLWCKEKP